MARLRKGHQPSLPHSSTYETANAEPSFLSPIKRLDISNWARQIDDNRSHEFEPHLSDTSSDKGPPRKKSKNHQQKSDKKKSKAAAMATELTVQSERAFQKQPHIFVNSKVKAAKSKRVGKGGRRWYKDVGLGFRTPKTAIEGTYIDKKCPFTGQVSIRGRILTGTVVSTKMHRTLIIRREYLHFIPKYARYEKRHKNLAAHVSPCFRVEEGDKVTVGQCRPLSKTVRFNVLRVLPRTNGLVKQFVKF